MQPMKKSLVLCIFFHFIVFSRFLPAEPLFFTQPQAYPLFSGGLPYIPRPLTTEKFPFHVELSLNWWNAFRFDFRQFSPHLTYVDSEGVLGSVVVQSTVTPALSLGLRLEFQIMFAGILDTPIEGFHHLFSLPNQGRENVSQNQFRLYHDQDGNLIIDLSEGVMNLNLIYFWGRHALLNFPTGQLALITGLKPPLPWGLLSSLSWAIHTGLEYLGRMPELNFWWLTQLGLGWTSTPFLPQGQGWNLLWQASLSVGWQFLPSLTVYGSLDGQGSPYLGQPSVSSGRQGNFLIATAWEFSPHTFLVFGLQEEGLTWASVEVGFLIYLVYRNPARVYDE